MSDDLDARYRFDLLKLVSHARHMSNAYLDTIRDSALVAFLNVNEIHRNLSSIPDTTSAFDIFMEFATGLVFRVGEDGLKRALGLIIGRVANSRAMIGSLVTDIERASRMKMVKLRPGVFKRLNVKKFEDFLAVQRTNKAQSELIKSGIDIFSKEARSKAIKMVGTSGSKGKRIDSIDSRVGIVDNAMSEALYQKTINNMYFDKLESIIYLQLYDQNALKSYIEEGLNDFQKPLQGENNAAIYLNEVRQMLLFEYERISWAMLIYKDRNYNKELTSGVSGGNPRITLYKDENKDTQLTKYLLKNFSRNRAYLTPGSTASDRNILLEDFKKIAKEAEVVEKYIGKVDIK